MRFRARKISNVRRKTRESAILFELSSLDNAYTDTLSRGTTSIYCYISAWLFKATIGLCLIYATYLLIKCSEASSLISTAVIHMIFVQMFRGGKRAEIKPVGITRNFGKNSHIR